MKIALIGTRGIPPNYGGSETYVEQLALQLAARGDEVWVYGSPLSQGSRREEVAERYGPLIHLIHVPTLRTKHADNFIRSLFAAVHVCFMRHIEVVQFVNVGPSLLAVIPRLCGKKVVGAIRSLDSNREKWGRVARWYLRLCERLIFVVCHETIANSKAIVRHYQETYRRFVHYVPNGITVGHQSPAPQLIRAFGLEGRDYILFSGRLVPEKGCHILLQAFQQLAWPDVKLVIAGGDSFASEYAAMLKKEADSRVLFLGHVNGRLLEELYEHAYAFVLPSSVEGMSNSLLSAMAHGRPVIVSDIPENLAVIEDAPVDPVLGEAPALTFRLGDAADLADKLQILRDSPALAERRGDCLRAYVYSTYSWESSADLTRSIYQALAADTPYTPAVLTDGATSEASYSAPPAQTRKSA